MDLKTLLEMRGKRPEPKQVAETAPQKAEETTEQIGGVAFKIIGEAKGLDVEVETAFGALYVTKPLTIESPDSGLMVAVKDAGLTEQHAAELVAKFAPLVAEARQLVGTAQSIQVNDASQTAQMKLARATRLSFRDVRIRSDKLRKELKEDSLRRGKAIDGMFHVIDYMVNPFEVKLLEAEQFAERKEAERIRLMVADRENALRTAEVDPRLYRLEDLTDEQMKEIITAAIQRKAEYARLAAETARRQAEDLAKAEKERIERAELERKRAAEEKAARQKREALFAEERRRAEELAKAERAKAAEAEAKAREERQRAEKAERELRERKAADAKRALDEEKARKKAARAPDKEKLKVFATMLGNLAPPEMKTDEGQQLAFELKNWLADVAGELQRKADAL